MINPYSSDVVQSHQQLTLSSGQSAEVLTLVNGNALVISADGLALYKTPEQVNDALGNGLMDSVSLPDGISLAEVNGQFVLEYKAGFIGLQNDVAILVTPNNVRLYGNKKDALSNQHQVVQLDF